MAVRNDDLRNRYEQSFAGFVRALDNLLTGNKPRPDFSQRPRNEQDGLENAFYYGVRPIAAQLALKDFQLQLQRDGATKLSGGVPSPSAHQPTEEQVLDFMPEAVNQYLQNPALKNNDGAAPSVPRRPRMPKDSTPGAMMAAEMIAQSQEAQDLNASLKARPRNAPTLTPGRRPMPTPSFTTKPRPGQ